MAPPTSKYKSATYYPASKKYVIEDENGIRTEIKEEFILMDLLESQAVE
jgi:hypothetical protein